MWTQSFLFDIKILIYFLIIFSFLTVIINHPVSLTGIIIIHSLFISLILWNLNKTRWFSLILFLIFLGGLIVLFIYIVRLARNEKFKISKHFLKYLIIFIIISLLLNYTPLIKNKINYEINFNFNHKEIIILFYNHRSFIIIFLLIFYLLICLIIIVSLISIIEGPLRSTIK